jgi:PcfJ-like protein
MPSTSSKQARFMQAVKHSPKFAKKVGVSQSVGADFVAADKAAGKYAKGGPVCTCSPLNKAQGGAVGCPCGRKNMAGGGSIASLFRAITPKLSKAKAPLTQVAEGAKVPLGELVQAGQSMRYPPAQRGAVRVKGGNFNEPRLEAYLGPPESPTFAMGDVADTPNQADVVGTWKSKQLANYLRKDIGSPTDPLLQVEKEYSNLHLPEGELAHRDVTDAWNRFPPGRDHAMDLHRSITSEPLTPWGAHSDRQLSWIEPITYGDELTEQMPWMMPWIVKTPEPPEWLSKLPKDAKIWGLKDPSADKLGFEHVLDYLNAAKTAHEQVTGIPGGIAALRAGAPGGDPRQAGLQLFDAGLALSPEQISRTSVADAVRKTARWNEFMAKNQEASPDLAKGIKAVHKEYPEEGMKWVELGEKSELSYTKDNLPEGWKIDLSSKGLYRVEPVRGDPRGAFPNATEQYRTPEEAVAEFNQMAAKQDLSAGLNAEGKAMGHCVGGYCEEVASRGTKIYSLRDAKGNPHVTVEVRPSRKDPMDNFWDALSEEEQQSIRKTALGPNEEKKDQFLSHERHRKSVELIQAELLKRYPEVATLPASPEEIIQIKGKQNAAPVEKYLPFVQDFVKSGQWGNVGDLRNTGLVDVEKEFEGAAYLPEMLKDLGARYVNPKEVLDHPLWGKYFSEQKRYRNYAEGGSVVDVGDPSRRGARTTWRRDAADAGDAIGAFSDMVSGAARGAAKAAIGWPGDIERLIGTQIPAALSAALSAPPGERLETSAAALESTAKSPTLFPTMEEVGNVLPDATRFSMRPGQTNPFESLTEFAPVSPAQVGRAAKFGASQARKLVDEVMSPVPRQQAQRGAVDVVYRGERGGPNSPSFGAQAFEGKFVSTDPKVAQRYGKVSAFDASNLKLLNLDKASPQRDEFSKFVGFPVKNNNDFAASLDETYGRGKKYQDLKKWLSERGYQGIQGNSEEAAYFLTDPSKLGTLPAGHPAVKAVTPQSMEEFNKQYGMAGGGAIIDLLKAVVPKLSRSKAPLAAVSEASRVPLEEMIAAGQAQRYPARAVPEAQRGAVRMKGGNFNEAGLQEYLGLPEAPVLGGMGVHLRLPDELSPVGQWKSKQLANYLRKDIGSPSDPLLQVEKEYPNLHLPNMPDALTMAEWNVMSPGKSTKMDAHRALTSEPLTAWGLHSDVQLESLSPSEYARLLRDSKTTEPPEWLSNLPKDTKIWGLSDTTSDELGFGHVLDYLKAAESANKLLGHPEAIAVARNMPRAELDPAMQNALGLVDAGLALSPEQISRTSVADAVRKTARWNEFMAKNQESSTELAKGIKAVHKEYPQEGMKWVELGVPEVPKDYQLPEGFKIVKVPSGNYGVQQKTETGYYKMAADEAETPEKAVAKYYGEQELTAGLNAEGKAMGHCVGGYCEEVASRGTKIYSLRDEKGNPHVTVEVRPGRVNNEDIWDAMPQEDRAKLVKGYPGIRRSVSSFSAAGFPITILRRDYPEAFQRAVDAAAPEIIQIKGKQNAAPVEKYAPFIQDFVKSKKWGKIGDLENTGMYDLNDGLNASMFPTLSSMSSNNRQLMWSGYKRTHPNDLYATPEEIIRWAQENPGAHGAKFVTDYRSSKFVTGGSVKSRALTLVDEEMDPIERLGHMCDVAMTE